MSTDVEDRRGARRGMGGLPMLGAGLGVPGIILFVVIMLLNNGGGGNGGGGGGLDDVLNQLNRAPQAGRGQPPEADQKLAQFMSFVLDDAQAFWTDVFASSGKRYERARLVLFQGGTSSACGGATSDVGPHYCPADQKVYIDLDFFRELRNRFGAPGDFAQAYVLAHEIGHHVQNLLGIMDEVQQRGGGNELSVRLELQADCFAGVWAYTTYKRDLLESGDLEEGLRAAAAVGDDRLQKQSGQGVNPETFTHGTSEQRTHWFRQGFDTGDPQKCDTFSASDL